MPKQSLQELQDWMKTVLTSRGNLSQKLTYASQESALLISDIIESKKGVSAERRLDIYASGYVLRLVECLESEFPALKLFMGNEVFEIFAKAYIVSCPPDSWSLYELGKGFPEFLRKTKPSNGEKDLIEIPTEIAQFERMQSESLYLPGNEEQEQTYLHMETPMNFLFDERFLHFSPCFNLLKQNYKLDDFLNELQQGKTVELPAKKACFLIITRVNYRVRIVYLDEWQFHFLKAAMQNKSIEESAQFASGITGIKTQFIFAYLIIWLPQLKELGCRTHDSLAQQC